jgi:hypothetical protein
MIDVSYKPIKYKYNPSDFTAMPCLAGELSKFYRLHETYAMEKTNSTRLDLTYHWWENLFFTIKHREAEGSLSPADAGDMRHYLEEFLHDG